MDCGVRRPCHRSNFLWRSKKKVSSGQASSGPCAKLPCLRTQGLWNWGPAAASYSAVFARRGANVTVLDYSKTALDVSAELFSKLGLAQTQVLADAMHLPSDLVGQFDISSSFGVCEHFEGEDRYRIISSHFDVLRPGGLAIISVPNARCLPYRIWKAKREILGTWQFGLEIPFSRQELSAISRRAGMRTHGFVGSSFIDSFDYLLPFARWKRSLLKRFAPTRLHDPSRLKKRNPSAMDAYFGAAVVLIAQKPLPTPG
jgi:SAM-dependent methyltransferase